MNLKLHISSLCASYARARAKVSIRVKGRLNNNSWRIIGFKPVKKKLMRRGSEIFVTLFKRSSKATWKSEAEPV